MIVEIDYLVLVVLLIVVMWGMLNVDILVYVKFGLYVINVCCGEVVDDDVLW